MEYFSHGVFASPGQLWRNVRTGDILFVYKRASRIEAVFCDGRRISGHDVTNLKQGINGWKCVYLEQPGNADYDTDEFG